MENEKLELIYAAESDDRYAEVFKRIYTGEDDMHWSAQWKVYKYYTDKDIVRWTIHMYYDDAEAEADQWAFEGTL